MEKFTIIGDMTSTDWKNYTLDLKEYLDIVPSPQELRKEKRIIILKKGFIFVGRFLKVITFLFLIFMMFFNLFPSIDSFYKEDNFKNLLIFISFSVLIYFVLFRMKERKFEDIYTHVISNEGVLISNDIDENSLSWSEISKVDVLKNCIIFEVKRKEEAKYPFIPVRFFKDHVEMDKIVVFCNQKVKDQKK